MVDTRDKTWKSYAVNRTARIYSVVIPALVLTIAVDIYIAGHSGVALSYQYSALWKYLPLYLTFSQEFWLLNEVVLSNGVFWSLSYEVWYYIAYAVMMYVTGPKKYWLLAGIALLVGPRILMLSPIWFLGVVIYNIHSVMDEFVKAKRIFFWSLVTLGTVFLIGVDAALNSLFRSQVSFIWRFRFSGQWMGDYLDGALIGLSILSVKYVNLNSSRFRSAITTLSGLTFTLYLVHYPIIEIVQYQEWHWAWNLPITAVVTWTLSNLCDRQKHVWAIYLNALITWCTERYKVVDCHRTRNL